MPYIVGTDLNSTPEASPVARRFMDSRRVIDVPAAFGLGHQHNFAAKGPEKDAEGPRRTKIDTMFANSAAMALITCCTLEWELVLHDHVPIKVMLSTEGYKAMHKTETPPALPAHRRS